MISVLMCTYNREHYLRRAIDSVLNQTYRDIEFVIVDDGSTDHTEELVKSYTDERLRYIKMERNSFYCYAANYGLNYCKGDYVAFMNSDDVWALDKLEKQICFMEGHTEYGACFTAVSLIDNQGNDVTDECWEMRDLFQKQYDSQKECLQFLLKHKNSLCHPSALVKKEIMDQVGGFNLMYCQLADYDLWIRIVTQVPVYVLQDRLIQFRWDMKTKDQISVATVENAVRAFNEQVLIRKQLIERLSDEKLIEFFGDWFKNKKSVSHLELEFERAFILAECMSEASELKVLGIEKLEQVMRMPKAMEVLRNHFKMDIFELYNWNKAHMYWTPWLMNDYERLELTINHQSNLLIERDVQIENQKLQINNLKLQIEQQKLQIAQCVQRGEQKENQIVEMNSQIEQQKQLIDTYANSTSWKMTEPLRRFMRMFKK